MKIVAYDANFDAFYRYYNVVNQSIRVNATFLIFFQAQNDTELSFDKGDRLEIIDRPANDPDWFKARNTQAQVRDHTSICIYTECILQQIH